MPSESPAGAPADHGFRVIRPVTPRSGSREPSAHNVSKLDRSSVRLQLGPLLIQKRPLASLLFSLWPLPVRKSLSTPAASAAVLTHLVRTNSGYSLPPKKKSVVPDRHKTTITVLVRKSRVFRMPAILCFPQNVFCGRKRHALAVHSVAGGRRRTYNRCKVPPGDSAHFISRPQTRKCHAHAHLLPTFRVSIARLTNGRVRAHSHQRRALSRFTSVVGASMRLAALRRRDAIAAQRRKRLSPTCSAYPEQNSFLGARYARRVWDYAFFCIPVQRL